MSVSSSEATRNGQFSTTGVPPLELGDRAERLAEIDVLREQLKRFGHTGESVRSVEVKNSSSGVLYHLVYVSNDQLGDKIWESIVKTFRGQRSLF